ncbi:MAG: ribonuclease H family protein [Saprospiraceae bacterium]|nr:ribonuclease H family protein [Saprospiraceae bacterium]MDW8230863.1 ribonuclease H family protein [Saprospiraceae bacterium]
MAKARAFYVVWEGVTPGIYTSWEEVRQQTHNYPGAKYKRFASREEAEAAYRGSYWSCIKKPPRAAGPKSPAELQRLGVRLDSLAVDAACSGNPGLMEYRGVRTDTGEELFRSGPWPGGTNNIGEFLALVHALAWLHQRGLTSTPIYSDSRNAQKWVREKKCRTKLEPTPENEKIFDLIQRAEHWLQTHPTTNPILDWDTEKWGENPADFGRK